MAEEGRRCRSPLTDEPRLRVVGVDDDDALVSGVDIDQRALDVLLQLARLDVYL